MTPTEIEARFAQYENRIATLEGEQKANHFFGISLIGSHHDTDLLLAMVRRAIREARGKPTSGAPSVELVATVARLEEIERQIQGVQKAVLQLAEEKERDRQAELRAREAQRAAVTADLGKGLFANSGPDRER